MVLYLSTESGTTPTPPPPVSPTTHRPQSARRRRRVFSHFPNDGPRAYCGPPLRQMSESEPRALSIWYDWIWFGVPSAVRLMLLCIMECCYIDVYDLIRWLPYSSRFWFLKVEKDISSFRNFINIEIPHTLNRFFILRSKNQDQNRVWLGPIA